METLLSDLPEEVTADVRAQLRNLSEQQPDVLSVRTVVTMPAIDTGDARTMRQPLRRQPLLHRVVDDVGSDSPWILEMGVSSGAPGKSDKLASASQSMEARFLFSLCPDCRRRAGQLLSSAAARRVR